MDLLKQQSQDAITLSSLQHTIEESYKEIKRLTKESADLCLSIKNNVNKHHESVGHLLLNLSNGETITEFENVLKDFYSIVNTFYDKEYIKCCHSTTSNKNFQESSFNKADDEDNIILSVEDLLDKRIEKLETMLL